MKSAVPKKVRKTFLKNVFFIFILFRNCGYVVFKHGVDVAIEFLGKENPQNSDPTEIWTPPPQRYVVNANYLYVFSFY